jgi:glutathionylspermidine synthase
LFGFPAFIEEMILAPAGYGCPIPLMRMDVFFDEDTYDFKFCEFNTDGTSGMHEEMIISSRLAETRAFEAFANGRAFRQYPLVEGWIDAFTEIYTRIPAGARSRRLPSQTFWKAA